MRLVPGTLLDLIVILINRNDDHTRSVARGVMDLFSGTQNIESNDQTLIKFYLSLLKQLIAEKVDKDSPDLLLAAYINFETSTIFDGKPELKDLVRQLFSTPTKLEPEVVDVKISRMVSYLKGVQSQKYAKDLYRRTHELNDIVDDAEREHLVKELEKFIAQGPTQTGQGLKQKSGFNPAEHLNTDDRESVRKSLNVYSERNSTCRILKLGMKGLTRACGPIGGIPAGRSVCFVASAHSYKSSMLRSIFVWTVLYNPPPPPSDPADTRPPAIYFCSVENGTHEDIVWIYRKMYYHLHKCEPELNVESVEWREQVTDWIIDFTKSRGYTLIMQRFLPSELPGEKIIDIVDDLLDRYRIDLTIVDYLAKCTPDAGLARDQQMAKLFSDTCNWFKNKGITYITAHQTNSTFGSETQNKSNKVKYGVDRHCMNGPDALREVDILFFTLIERNNFGIPFLTVYKVKDRYRNDTAEIDRYFAYQSQEPGIGGFPDDIDTDDIMYVRDINDVRGDQQGAVSAAVTTDSDFGTF